MQVRKKKLLNRILSIALAIITTVTVIPINTVPVHAEFEVENDADVKGFGGVMPSPGDEWMGWYSQTQGYRIYVINPKLERITPVYDFYFRDPYEFYDMITTDSNINYMRTTRFDAMEAGEYEEWGYGESTIDELVDWCSATTTPPYPYKQYKPYKGQGDKFRDWFYAGFEGEINKDQETETIIETPKPTKSPEPTTGADPTTAPGNQITTPTPNCTTCNDKKYITTACIKCDGTGRIDIVTTKGLTVTANGTKVCDFCNGKGTAIIKCSCVGYQCNDCYDTALCSACKGNGHTGSLACATCSATGICQKCIVKSEQCTTCQGEGTVPCPTCEGTGQNVSVGPELCNTCIGYGYINCRTCSEIVNCETCGRNMTDYYKIAFGDKQCRYCWYTIHHDGKCNDCGADCNKICNASAMYVADCFKCITNGHKKYIEYCDNCINGLKTCNVCGTVYDQDSTCTYCKCPSCGTQMTLISNVRESVTKFHCSTCNKNVTYNTNDNTIKIAVPDSYWKLTSKLSYTTQTEIANAKTIIEQAKNYTPGQYYHAHLSEIGNIDNVAKSMIQEKFNAKFNGESKISPYDALLYATSIVADIIHTNYPGDPYYAEEHKAAVNYEIYSAFKIIQDSQEYKDLYYTIQTLTSSTNPNQLYTSLLTNPIPLTNKNKEASKVPAVNLINSDKIKFPNEEYVSTDEKSALHLAMEDGCLIIVEPLCGFRMKCDVKNGEPQWGKYWAYGSFWNIAQHWYDKDGGIANYYWEFLTDLTNNCLVTGKDFTTKDGYTIFKPVNAHKDMNILESRKQMSSLSKMVCYETTQDAEPSKEDYDNPIHGLSMHLYNMDVSQTITWDKALVNPDITEETPYSHLIGASPDHTEKVAEEKRSDPAKHANIVKFYETTDPATGETTYEIFSREVVPRKIEIVDEEVTTGYKLIEWYTTDKLCTDLSNPRITWDKLLHNDGFDPGNIGKLSWEHETLECLDKDAYGMKKIVRVKTTGEEIEVQENTLYLLYRKGDATTSTYDELLGDQIGPSPDDTHKLVKETTLEGGEYLNEANIIKVYEKLDQAGNVISTEVFVRKQVPNTIKIEDESEATGYILTDWFTGSAPIAIREEQTYTDFYEYYSKRKISNPHVFIVREVSADYTTPEEYETHKEELFQTIDFKEFAIGDTGESLENVLYLHYIYKPNPETSTYDEELEEPGPAPDDSDKVEDSKVKANIVKFYETINSETDELMEFSIFVRYESPTKILIEDEPELGYTVKKWFTSTEFMADEEITFDETAEQIPIIIKGSRATEEPVDVLEKVEDVEDVEEITLYVQLQKEEEGEDFDPSEWTLEESELSKAFKTGDNTTRTSITWNYGSLKNGCDGHYSYTDEDGDRHYTYCRSWSFTDSSYTFKLKNSNESKYKNVIALSTSFKTKNNSISETRTILSSGSISVSGFNYEFVAHRGDDKLTLAEYANKDNVLKEVKEIGYTIADSKTKLTRKTKSYNAKLSILLVDNSTDKRTSSTASRCSDSDTAKTTGKISYSGEVTVKVYSGEKRETDTTLNTSKMVIQTLKSKTDMTSGRQVASGAEVKFNPYIRMTYRLLGGTKKDVYVLGEYERTLLPNDYVEIEWKKEQESLQIQSQMWATDSILTSKSDKKAWTDTNQVLKGGATYQLTTRNQKIKLNTYQTILTGESRDISTIKGDYDLSIKQATDEHKKFVKEAINTLDSMELAQYVNTDPDAEFAWSDGGIKVYSGANIKDLKNGSTKASTDKKYYLHSNVNKQGDTSRADLDVKEHETEYKFYRFYSDTSGNIYMVRSSKLEDVEKGEGLLILIKSQGEEDLYKELMEEHGEILANEIIELDKRTSALTKLLAALERNTGKDKTASWAKEDGKWYNEAFNGIIVVIQKTTVEVGLGNEIRTTVLDPKLIPKTNNKNDMGSEAFVSQYKMDFTEDTKMCTFKGQEVFMKGIEQLFSSKKFYIPNMTVQDGR